MDLALAPYPMGKFGFRLTLATGTTFRVPLAMGLAAVAEIAFGGGAAAAHFLPPLRPSSFSRQKFISAAAF